MATIQKVKNKNGISYKVFIRNKGLKSIIKTFSKKQLATQFIHQMESDAQARVNYNNHSDKTFNEIVAADTNPQELFKLEEEYGGHHLRKDNG